MQAYETDSDDDRDQPEKQFGHLSFIGLHLFTNSQNFHQKQQKLLQIKCRGLLEMASVASR